MNRRPRSQHRVILCALLSTNFKTYHCTYENVSLNQKLFTFYTLPSFTFSVLNVVFLFSDIEFFRPVRLAN